MTRTLRQTALVGAIWLTAASTLFASLPHIECRCPDGTIKLICLASLVDPARCCAKAKPACCRKHAPAQPAPDASTPSDGTAQLKRTGCTRQIVQPGVQALAYTEVSSDKHSDQPPVDLLTPSLSGTVQGAPSLNSILRCRCACHAPAPPDLVIVLQHFLI
jgi:hypothetical protein